MTAIKACASLLERPDLHLNLVRRDCLSLAGTKVSVRSLRAVRYDEGLRPLTEGPARLRLRVRNDLDGVPHLYPVQLLHVERQRVVDRPVDGRPGPGDGLAGIAGEAVRALAGAEE